MPGSEEEGHWENAWGAAGWKAVAPLDKHSISSVVFTNYEHISTNVTAATEL